MTKPRRAKLTIHCAGAGWLRLSYRNGEPAMHSEMVKNPKRARAAIIRAMVDVLTEDAAGVALVIAALEREGYVLLTEEKLGRLIDTAKRHIREEIASDGFLAAQLAEAEARDE